MLATIESNRVYVPEDADEELKKAERNSERVHFLRLFWKNAIERAKERGLAPGSPEAWRLVEQADEIGRELALPLVGSWSYMTIWHREQPYEVSIANMLWLPKSEEKIEFLKGPRIIRGSEELQEGVKSYLEGEWRCGEADRVLVKMLIEAELGKHVQIMIRPDTLDYRDRRSKYEKSKAKLGKSTKNILISTAWALTIGVFYVLSQKFEEYYEFLFTLALAVAAIGVSRALLLLIGTLRSSKDRDTDKTIVEQVRIGLEILSKYESNTPIAISELRKDITNLQEKRYVLPGVLIVFLEILESEGRFMI